LIIDYSYKTKHSGFATLIVLILLLTLTWGGLEGFIRADAGLRMIKRQAQSCQAVYYAEAGIEWAKSQLLINPEWSGGSKSVAGNQTKVSISVYEDGYWVTSLAVSGFAKREIKVYLKRNSDKWIMTNYQELHR
jgi:hypothetical protein